jgi:hypothetical protein
MWYPLGKWFHLGRSFHLDKLCHLGRLFQLLVEVDWDLLVVLVAEFDPAPVRWLLD